MAQVAVQRPSEAPIWVHGATASAWYEAGSATRCERVSAVRGTCCCCKCVPLDAMHNSTQSLNKGKRDLENTACVQRKESYFLLCSPRADTVENMKVDAPSHATLQVSRQLGVPSSSRATPRAQREQRVPVGCQWLALGPAAPSQC